MVEAYPGQFFVRDQNLGFRRFTGQDLRLPSQQSPGGMGLPCGQVLGCPRNVQMRASSSGLMMCSNRSEEHTSELQSRLHLVCRLLLEKKKKNKVRHVRRT